jgi:hypothetical protein
MSDVGEFGMWIAVAVGSASFFAAVTPVLKAYARRIEGRSPALVEDRLAELERRGLVSGEVELTRERLAELEERLDFAERLLARQKEADRLPGAVPE